MMFMIGQGERIVGLVVLAGLAGILWFAVQMYRSAG